MTTITPALHICNEAYWIHYGLRDILKVFGKAIMIDTGSTDDTVLIARKTAEQVGAELTIIEENMGNNANAIGNCPNRLREMVQTDWMLLVDGDEIWREEQLRNVDELASNIPSNYEVAMFWARNVTDVGGVLKERDGFVADRLFRPTVRWDKSTEYPWQSHRLEERDHAGKVFRVDFGLAYFWHVRHLCRSSKDADAFYRVHKLGYFPYQGEYTELPSDWCGQVEPSWPNPYLTAEA